MPTRLDWFEWLHLRDRVASGTAPRLPLFGSIEEILWAACHEADPSLWKIMELRMEALSATTREVQRRRERKGVQSFDDLLQNLLDALENGEAGNRLAARLRERFPAVLIDEFQDTDPVQFRIFDLIDPPRTDGGVLFFVGDPKQAIYGFRRADVFAYIDARRGADNQYSLGTNRRSTKQLVDGVNALFDVSSPFLLDDLEADPVAAIEIPERGRLVTEADEDTRPLRFTFLRRPETVDARGTRVTKSLTKEAATRLAVRDTVGKIVRLLDPARGARLVRSTPDDSGRDGNGERIRGGSIAVLVRTNRQAREIRQGLTDAGVASVLAVQSSVFGTEVAADLELVLQAVRDPSNERL
ncbi:MAG: UvrD-helicase domain-containing protein, partial [Verrucomicrobia bacterium]|nr:UvrD-helicase domain-containing protein [Verrucomicrobiota bacterium]